MPRVGGRRVAIDECGGVARGGVAVAEGDEDPVGGGGAGAEERRERAHDGRLYEVVFGEDFWECVS